MVKRMSGRFHALSYGTEFFADLVCEFITWAFCAGVLCGIAVHNPPYNGLFASYLSGKVASRPSAL